MGILAIQDLIDYSKSEYTFYKTICNLSVEKQYEALQTHLEYVTLKDLKKLNMNIKTKEELSNISSIESLHAPFLELALSSGKTKKGAETLFDILELLFSICLESTSGMCHPSMLTMAFMIEPSLEYVLDTDSAANKKRKNNAISKVKIKISRAVKELEKMGLIKTFQYYTSEKHFLNKKKKPSFAYYIVPISISLSVEIKLKHKIVYEKGMGAFVQSLIKLTKNVNAYIIKQMQVFTKQKSYRKEILS